MNGSDDLIKRYNYDEFTREKVLPWLRFDQSPALGQRAPDFPLWDLDGEEIQLHTILKAKLYTIVEFGSFT